MKRSERAVGEKVAWMPPTANEDAVEEANWTFATVTAKPAAAEKVQIFSEPFSFNKKCKFSSCTNKVIKLVFQRTKNVIKLVFEHHKIIIKLVNSS